MKDKKLQNDSIDKRIKRPRSGNMVGMKSQLPKIKNEILASRQKQSKLLNQVKEDIKKIRENNLSVIGLEQLSPRSVQKIHEKRKKVFTHMMLTVNEIEHLLKEITKLETQYRKNFE